MFSLNKAQVSSNKPPGFLFYEKMKEKESPLNLEEEKPTSEDKIMDGIIFTIGGIGTPLKGELRNKMLEMGAKYIPICDPTLTHFIGGNPSSDKATEAKTFDALLVSKNWIEDCYRKKKRLPEESYLLLTDSEANLNASIKPKTTLKRQREELQGEKIEPQSKKPLTESKSSQKVPKEKSGSDTDEMDSTELKNIKNLANKYTSLKGKDKEKSGSDTDEMSQEELETIKNKGKPSKSEKPGSDTDEMNSTELKNLIKGKNSGSDTEELTDEELLKKIEKVRSDNQKKFQPLSKSSSITNKGKEKTLTKGGSDTEGLSGEELENLSKFKKQEETKPSQSSGSSQILKSSDYPKEDRKDTALPDFLTDVKLYLHSLDSNTKKEVTRYCVAYGGEIVNSIDSCTHLISSEWHYEFDSYIEQNSSMIILKPSWIMDCHKLQKKVSPQKYLLIQS